MTAFWTETDRDFLRVSGADALTYLQSQISQDIRGLVDGASAYSFVLQPMGKIDALVRIVRYASDDFVLDTDPGFGEGLLARLNRFKIRVKVDIATLPWRCIAIRGAENKPADAVAAWGRPDAYDFIGADLNPPPFAATIRPGSPTDLELARIRAGWPTMGCEITDASIPAETGVIGEAVNFTKGCYPGQELVERMDSRGSQAPRFVRQLRGPNRLVVGDEVTRDHAVLGHITSAAEELVGTSSEALGWIALAIVARAAHPGELVSVGGHELTLAEARG